MVVGEKRRLWIPEALAYKGQPGGPQGMLVFDVELARDGAVADRRAARRGRAARRRQAAPPSGLAYKVLQGRHRHRRTRAPPAASPCTTRAGQTDGKMFDSSVMRGSPATFGLDEVIAGWTEGVQLMVVGEKTRFWIPQRPGVQGTESARRRGMLVFDVELIAIRD